MPVHLVSADFQEFWRDRPFGSFLGIYTVDESTYIEFQQLLFMERTAGS